MSSVSQGISEKQSLKKTFITWHSFSYSFIPKMRIYKKPEQMDSRLLPKKQLELYSNFPYQFFHV